MKKEVLGSDNLNYSIAWFKTKATNILHYQIKGIGLSYYNSIVMKQIDEYHYINDIEESIKADVESFKRCIHIVK